MNDIHAKVNMKVSGHFHLTAINSVTGDVREVAEFDNLIVNQGLDELAVSPSTYGARNSCSVGTGTTPEAAGDTVMEAWVATTGQNPLSVGQAINTSTTPYYSDTIYTYQFGVGAAAGNLTEIGIVAWYVSTPIPSARPLFAHSLIKDGTGTPITITILSDEILNVVWTFRTYVPVADFTGTFSLNIDGTPTSFDYVIRPAGVTNNSLAFWAWPANQVLSVYRPFGSWASSAFASNFAFGAITGQPTGTSSLIAAGQESLATYIPGTYTTSNTVIWDIGNANFTGGIYGFQWGIMPLVWQMSVTPAIPKVNTQVLTMHFAVSWADAS